MAERVSAVLDASALLAYLADAVEIARLRPRTRAAGLSLGDRACLALARRLSVQTLTADQAWVGAELGVDVVAIRPASA